MRYALAVGSILVVVGATVILASTPKFFPKYASDGTLVDSAVYEDGSVFIHSLNSSYFSGLYVTSNDYSTNGGYIAVGKGTGMGAYGVIQSGDNNAYRDLALNPLGGNVGIGTTAPLGLLHLSGGVGTNGLVLDNGVMIRQKNTAGTITNVLTRWSDNVVYLDNFDGAINIRVGPSTASAMFLTATGNVGIGTTAPTTKLHVVGDVTVTGNIAAKYQDVAEWVRAKHPLDPGTVVVVGKGEINSVETSQRSYDTTVVGVVSEKPGLMLGEAGDDKVLVAQSGRVRVKVDASYGAVHEGDLLVTSPKPGVAMKSKPIAVGGTTFHRPGTLLGKALEPLESGRGEILVLLTLQ